MGVNKKMCIFLIGIDALMFLEKILETSKSFNVMSQGLGASPTAAAMSPFILIKGLMV